MSTTIIAERHNSPNVLVSLLMRTFEYVEQLRLRTHLRIVEQELRRKDVTYLSPELQQERTKNIAHLHRYWTTGLFPKNTDFYNQILPHFKDRYGTPCAMAYLIEQSGHQDLVNEVARTNNNVYINDIHDGPVLAWIHKSGLTKAEAARVQPGYMCTGPGGCPEPTVPIIVTLLSWLISGVGFIALEWLTYKISLGLTFPSIPRKVVMWVYVIACSLVFAPGLWVIFWYFFASIEAIFYNKLQISFSNTFFDTYTVICLVAIYIAVVFLIHRISSWLTLDSGLRKITAWAFFTACNIIIAVLLWNFIFNLSINFVDPTYYDRSINYLN